MDEKNNIEKKARDSVIGSFFDRFKSLYSGFNRDNGESNETYNIVKVGTGTYLGYGSKGSVRDASRL